MTRRRDIIRDLVKMTRRADELGLVMVVAIYRKEIRRVYQERHVKAFVEAERREVCTREPFGWH